MKWERARKFLEAHIAARTFEELRIPFCCVAVDIKSGKGATFSSGDLLSAVLASGTIPAVFRPVEREGGLYVDGGVLCRVPVRQVKAMGADVVVAVDVLGRCRETEKVPHVLRSLHGCTTSWTTRARRRSAAVPAASPTFGWNRIWGPEPIQGQIL